MGWDRAKPRSSQHGHEHTKARLEWAARHHPSHLCTRCDLPLGPMGSWLHLDHDDVDKTHYLGFAHSRCNLEAAAHLGRERQSMTRIGASPLTF